jgi:hypothetical protein
MVFFVRSNTMRAAYAVIVQTIQHFHSGLRLGGPAGRQNGNASGRVCVSEPLRDDAPAYIVEIDAVLVVMRASSSSPSAGTGVAGAIGTGEPWK